MNKREKIMVAIISIVGLLFAGRAVKNGYVGKLGDLEKDVNKLEQKITKIKHQKQLAQKGSQEWVEIGRQTLSMDLNEAKELLRDELIKLTKQAGLPKAETNLIKQEGKVGKNGVKALKCKVDAEGDLKQIVKFLFEVYRQPYLVRCTDFELKKIPGTKKKPGRLRMTANFDTLILPANKRVRKVNPAELAANKRKVVPGRLDEDNLVVYQTSIKQDLFKPFEPTPRPTRKPRPTQKPRPGVKPTPTPTPKPPPPPDSGFQLARILSSPRGQQVILQDPKNRKTEDKRVEVGQTLYGGTLVFVHPTGAVSERDGKWRFHPMGLPMDQCKTLDQQEYPAVYHELTKLKQRAEGISRKDG